MKHAIREVSNVTVVALTGAVDLQHSPDARKILLQCVEKKRPILGDLGGVGYIDSSGVASLVECLQSARKAGYKLALVSVSDSAKRVLQLARLDRVFTVCETIEEGLEKVR